ncbi:MAG: hypothetical protein G8237_00580 [Magnetococcales bacterium]|nr:hypothetical protein [Magnetococcales bacterium]NGZ04835.1 hypothetical protein [Magnetococcales bacterium]
MMARPQPARWMRLLAVEEDLPAALITLAHHAPVEPEPLSGEDRTVLTPEISHCLQRFEALAHAWHTWWPTDLPDTPEVLAPHLPPVELLNQALTALEAWQLVSEPLIRQEQAGRTHLAELELLLELAQALDTPSLDLGHILHPPSSTQTLRTALFVLPLNAELTTWSPDDTLLRPVSGHQHRFLLVVTTEKIWDALVTHIANLEGRPLLWPAGLSGTGDQLQAAIQTDITACQADNMRIAELLHRLGEEHQVARWIRAVHQRQWYFQAIRQIRTGHTLAQLGGWVAPECQAATLNHHLQKGGIRALATLSDHGPGDPPLLLVNPWWARPFELFARLLGMPNRYEVDPSRLLALVAPLLFGYMFGDVGQGAVLVAIGFRLRRHFQAAWLLITGGLSAMFFGLLFGSLFCSESILPALWLHPTSHPLDLLLLPLLFGMGLILTGLGFQGVGAWWRGQGRHWLHHDGGVILLYLGTILTLITPDVGLILALAGILLFMFGNGWHAPRALPGRLAHLLETLLQLGVNTFSFARVGAFALAHAGLGQAVVTLADLSGGGLPGLMVMVVGNLLILTLEGLVVSVQTTRLILFEFFVRFLAGDGRPFRPLPPPE